MTLTHPNNFPKVGVGVIVVRNKKILLGKRKGSHGSGTWSFPGGHLEFGESIEDCAKREVFEETGIFISSPRNFAFTNDFFEKEGKHYVTLFVRASLIHGEPLVREPDKCEEWQWFNEIGFFQIPNLFLPVENLLKQGYNPFKP